MPVARLQSTVNHYRAQLAAHESQAEQTLAEAYQRALAALQPQLADLYKQMADQLANGGTISASWLYQSQRLERVKLGIQSQLNHYGSISQLTVQTLQHSGVQLGQQSGMAQLQAVFPANAHIELRYATQNSIANLIGATRAGSPLADLFRGFGAEAADNAGQALINGVALGRSAQKVARDVQAALDIERSRALTIARTELLRAYRSSSLEVYKQNSDVCGQWRWSAAKQGRTCAACLAMDGTLHDLSEMMESHPNCRCSPIPVPSNPAFQSAYQSGSDWLSEQDDSVQRQVLGNKYDGWKKGDFSLSDLVGTSHDSQWGGSIYVKSLKQVAA